MNRILLIFAALATAGLYAAPGLPGLFHGHRAKPAVKLASFRPPAA